MSARRVVQIVGDGVRGRWLSWRWEAALFSGGIHRVHGLSELAQELKTALPHVDPRDGTLLGLDGPLTRPDSELQLMRRFAEVLLPDALRDQLLSCHANGIGVEVRLAPSPPAAAVPWGLLPLDDSGLRLLEAADVSWIAPILRRDVVASPQPTWDQVRHLPSLHVLDPLEHAGLGAVLSGDEQLEVSSGRVSHGEAFTRADLSAALQEGISRLYLLGHCVTTGNAGDTGFLLSDRDSSYGVGPIHSNARPLSAADLIRGTLTHDGRSGAEIWSMPPRVAVVACASGADMADHEPFGFASALMHNGAELVHATLWMLPTGAGLAGVDPGARPAFISLAAAVDAAQGDDDPVRHLCDWQREQLHAWRERPGLATAPLTWAAALTMTAPPRRVEAAQQKRHSPSEPNREVAPSM